MAKFLFISAPTSQPQKPLLCANPFCFWHNTTLNFMPKWFGKAVAFWLSKAFGICAQSAQFAECCVLSLPAVAPQELRKLFIAGTPSLLGKYSCFPTSLRDGRLLTLYGPNSFFVVFRDII